MFPQHNATLRAGMSGLLLPAFRHFHRKFFLILMMSLSTASCKFIKSWDSGTSDLKISGDNLEGRFPAIGAIIDLATSQTLCTATLYTNHRVVTAAHCLAGKSAGNIGFAVDVDGQRKVAPIGQLFIHPGFLSDQENSTSDIAFFEITAPLPVAPIPLAIDGKDLVPSAQTLVVGYGHNSEKYDSLGNEVRTGSGVKRSALFTISRVDPIQIIYGEVSPTTFHGDSGGPHLRAATDGTSLIVGITSYGSNIPLRPLSAANRVDAFAHFLGSQPGKPEPTRTKVANCADYPEPGGRCVEGEVHFCSEAMNGFFLFRVRCEYPHVCGVNPQNSRTQCMLGKDSRSVKITLYDRVLDHVELKKGAPLAGYYVFVDLPPGRAVVFNPDVPRTNGDGQVNITTSEGMHTVKIADPKYIGSYHTLPEFQLKLDASSASQMEVTIVKTPVDLRVRTTPLSPGWSVYITGDTELVGNYRTALRLNYDSTTQNWVFKGFLPHLLEVRTLIVQSTDGTVNLGGGTLVLWDKKGPFQIGKEQPESDLIWRHEIEAQF